MNWISVKDRLPKAYERVLCCDGRFRSVYVGYIQEDKQRVEHEWINPNTTHWMPLPEQPKVE